MGQEKMKVGNRRERSRTKRLSALLLATVFWIGLTQSAAADEPITYRLKWLFNTSVVGDLYADSHHRYQRRG